MKKYDAIIVLSGGIVKTDFAFKPAGYFDSMTFGITGGKYRVIAAALLCKHEAAKIFIFTTGKYKKIQDLYGDEAPAEAHIYVEYFKNLLSEMNVRIPEIDMEDRSTTTQSNLLALKVLLQQRKLKHVGIISCAYHLPRIEALWKRLQQENPLDVSIDYIAAEDVLKTYLPGKYDQEISEAYNSPEGKHRQEMEVWGVKALQAGTYATQEFQLDPRSKGFTINNAKEQ